MALSLSLYGVSCWFPVLVHTPVQYSMGMIIVTAQNPKHMGLFMSFLFLCRVLLLPVHARPESE